MFYLWLVIAAFVTLASVLAYADIAESIARKKKNN